MKYSNRNIIFLYKVIINVITFYQKVISPLLPARCRYYPTCSQYGKQALAWHGIRSGSWLLLKRLARCHPLGGHGIDFVPLPLARYTYHPVSVISSKNQLLSESSSILYQRSYVFRDVTTYSARLNEWMHE